MTITDFSAKLADLQTAYHQMFSDLFLSNKPGANDAYKAFTYETSTDGTSFEYSFLSNDPVMREWIGDKNLVPLRGNSLRIPAKSYEKSTWVSRVELKGDRSGIIGERIGRWLAAQKRDKDLLAFSKLIDGFTEVGFDGVPLFSASHPNGPSAGLQSNLATTALSIAQFKVVKAAMESWRDENGESLNVSPDVLMVGPALADLAMQISAPYRVLAISATSGAETAVGGTAIAATSVPNTTTVSPYGGQGVGIKVVINPRLVGTYANYWFLIDSTKDGKPVVMADLGAPEAKDDLTQFNMLPNFSFSVEYDAAIGVGHWATIYGNQV